MEWTQKRKLDHIEICLTKPVSFDMTNGFENIELIRRAPISKDDIDIFTTFLGKKIDAPLMISGMTGGTEKAEKINKRLASAAEKFNVVMGVGSQRAAIENPKLAYTYKVRNVAENIFLLGNLGVAQIMKYNVEKIKKAVEMIDANALAIHYNPIHEAAQPEGDKNIDKNKFLEKLKEIVKEVDFPIVVKEVGFGISGDFAKELEKTGIAALDIQGAGGTNWAKVEYFRGSEEAKKYFHVGIKTAESLEQCVQSVNIPVIASGGIRTGEEIVKSLAMGASLAGMALPFLSAAVKSEEEVCNFLEKTINEIKTSMSMVGAKNIDELRGKYRKLNL